MGKNKYKTLNFRPTDEDRKNLEIIKSYLELTSNTAALRVMLRIYATQLERGNKK